VIQSNSIEMPMFWQTRFCHSASSLLLMPALVDETRLSNLLLQTQLLLLLLVQLGLQQQLLQQM